MVLNIEIIIWYLVLLDSIGANISAWFFPNWFKNKFKKIQKHFPQTKGWCLLYLILVLWIGYSLKRLNII